MLLLGYKGQVTARLQGSCYCQAKRVVLLLGYKGHVTARLKGSCYC